MTRKLPDTLEEKHTMLLRLAGVILGEAWEAEGQLDVLDKALHEWLLNLVSAVENNLRVSIPEAKYETLHRLVHEQIDVLQTALTKFHTAIDNLRDLAEELPLKRPGTEQ